MEVLGLIAIVLAAFAFAVARRARDDAAMLEGYVKALRDEVARLRQSLADVRDLADQRPSEAAQEEAAPPPAEEKAPETASSAQIEMRPAWRPAKVVSPRAELQPPSPERKRPIVPVLPSEPAAPEAPEDWRAQAAKLPDEPSRAEAEAAEKALPDLLSRLEELAEKGQTVTGDRIAELANSAIPSSAARTGQADVAAQPSEIPRVEAAPPAAVTTLPQKPRELVAPETGWWAQFQEREEAAPPAAVTTPPQRPPEPIAPGTEWWAKFQETLRTMTWAQFEEIVGKRWMTWVGVLALFLSAGFFVKYALDRQWMGDRARVALEIGFGIAVLALGEHFVRKKMTALGQGLLGGGLAILYVTLFAAFGHYKVIQQTAAFGSMVVVTAVGMWLAVRHDAVPVSFLAVLGGLLTPVMVSTGRDARDALFSYLLLLDVGVLGVAFFRRWRTLDILTFIGTWVLFAGWFREFYYPSAIRPTLLWLGGFYAVFLI
ncbi:MAG: DUF2339 domain-containing protein, partial [Planctomycetes bacterium]|nr:DUF2339 domain-containing protein [Planctomycetota bacterium]